VVAINGNTTDQILTKSELILLSLAEEVDIAGRLKPFPICVATLKSSVGFDKVGCARGGHALFSSRGFDSFVRWVKKLGKS
jgi:hypothetical protein